MRRAIVLLAFAAMLAAARGAVGVPPHEDVRVDLFGQPAQQLEVVGRPLGQTLAHNVFVVQRAISLSSGTHIPPLGRLSIDSRGTKAPTSVVVR